MKLRLFIFVIVLAIFAAPALANITACDFPAGLVVLSGQITDGTAPISGAYVTLKQTGGMVCEIAITNPFGYYSFSPVFTTSYIVTVSKKGCNGYENAITLNEDRVLNVALECD